MYFIFIPFKLLPCSGPTPLSKSWHLIGLFTPSVKTLCNNNHTTTWVLCLGFPYPSLWVVSLSFPGTTESGHMLCPDLTTSFSRPGPLLPLPPQSALLPALRSLHYCSIRAVSTAHEGFSCPQLQTCFHFFYKGWLWRPLHHTVWFIAPVTPFSVLTSVLHSSLFSALQWNAQQDTI